MTPYVVIGVVVLYSLMWLWGAWFDATHDVPGTRAIIYIPPINWYGGSGEIK